MRAGLWARRGSSVERARVLLSGKRWFLLVSFCFFLCYMKPLLDTAKACVVPQTNFAVHGLTVSLALFTSNAALDKTFRIVQACAAVVELYHQSLSAVWVLLNKRIQSFLAKMNRRRMLGNLDCPVFPRLLSPSGTPGPWSMEIWWNDFW